MHTLCVRVCVALVGASAFWRSSSSFACFARCSASYLATHRSCLATYLRQ